MTVTIKLSDEQAAALQAQAAEQGLSVDAWLQRLAEQYARVHAPSTTSLADDRPIWDVISDNMKDIPLEEFEKLPKDGASEHDHYLYGHPKRHQ
ncbi:MAG: hypothetical protein JO323_10005 [Acidobacteriia bacterium]|nr:hypothetical protein [Terriglobia bacterium]